jgi:hypothetical protein
MKKRKNNKKGFLLANETLKIIIAVICISFLVYLLSMIYLSKTGTQKRADAEKSLERIEEIINSLDVGESERQGIGNPKAWHIFSFTTQKKPNSCVGENCLCICKKVFDIGNFDRQIKECDSSGACMGIRGLQSRDLDIKIMGENSLVFLNIQKARQGIFIEQIR